MSQKLRSFRFRPALLDSLKHYRRPDFMADLGAGLTVACVALPLAMAFGIASGVKPEQGLITAIIGGALVSLLGGSKVQIGGPAGAFVAMLYGIALQYGMSNLLLATMMAGAILFLMESEKLSLKDMTRMLYHKSGLLGVSGLSPEPRVLLARENEEGEVGERIRDAMRLYVRRVIRQIGSLIAMMNGIDMLVFTAGVGENCAEIRRRILEGMTYFGIKVDQEANKANAPVISTPDSAVKVVIQPTNEEWIAARHAVQLLLGKEQQ